MKKYSGKTVFFTLILICYTALGLAAVGNPLADGPAVDKAKKAGLSNPTINRLQTIGKTHRLDPAEILEFLSFFISVKQRGFDVHPFLNKLEEGLVKRVPHRRIKAVLNQKFENYQFIETLAGNIDARYLSYYAHSIALLSDALDLGLSREDVRDLFDYRPGTPLNILAVAAENKAMLRQIDFPPDYIDAIVLSGLKNETLSFEWRKLFMVIDRAKKQGISNQTITKIVVQELESRGDIRAVLPALGFTERRLK